MESSWILIAVLTVTALVLIAIDFYLPGFVLGSIGVVLMIVGVVICYNAYGTSWAAALIVAETALGISTAYVAIKYVPHTAMGRKMILSHAQTDQRAGDKPGAELLGCAGVAQTPLRPAGAALIDGKRLDVVAESDMIDRGSPVKVVAVDGTRIVVRKA